MQDATRKLICRIGFLLVCLLPTLLTVSWIAWRCSPAYRAGLKRKWETALASCTGTIVQLDTLRPTGQDTLVLETVRLTDRETREWMATVRRMEIARRGGQLIVLLQQPEIKASRLPILVDAVCRQLETATPWPIAEIEIDVDDLTLRANRKSASRTLSDIHLVLDSGDGDPRATVEFVLAGLEMKEPAKLMVTRNRQVSPPATLWELRTGSAPLPCSLLADCVPALEKLGAHATFRGTVWATDQQRGCDLEITGEFGALDLDQLITAHFPHKLSGTARAVLNRGSVRHGRIVLAAGTLSSSRGVISRSLLNAAEEWLGATAAAGLRDRDAPLLPYQQLCFGFDIDQRGLTMQGQCEGSTIGTMLTDHQGATMLTSPLTTVPVVALLRVLVPDSEVQVPATQETRLLLGSLPLPPLVPSPRIGSRPPYSTLRLDDE